MPDDRKYPTVLDVVVYIIIIYNPKWSIKQLVQPSPVNRVCSSIMISRSGCCCVVFLLVLATGTGKFLF